MMCGLLTFCCVSRSEMFAKNVSAFAENISVYFFGGHGDRRDSPTSFTALLAPNLLAQFSLQIDIQILGLESPKVCGNHALLLFREICSTMNLLGIFHASNIRETLRMRELDFTSKNPIPAF
jgi:hypothetical protein